ncbi:nucleoside diphosphate kinase regulator [Thiorhodospira sibirica]|uniref:nucleoside diphosphate kinase regulator n=1 Tax=Thiorhodospira sibirica TaxID=154347 RepID=UPI00022C3A11|nr:nucleoside diphosphate kinase regulator [Thiorhodospira sibirica]
MSDKPKIIISSMDLERLENLLESLPAHSVPGMEALAAELYRAEVVEPRLMPPNVVTMNSKVRFKVDASQEEFCLTLVYPKDLDGSGEKISILAPVGSALLGLSEGCEIDWPKPGGGLLRVRIEEVVHQPERSGEYHR